MVDTLVSVTDVEVAISCAISTCSSTTLTLHHLTLNTLACNVSEKRIGSVDTVSVVSELSGFVHAFSMAENRWKVKG